MLVSIILIIYNEEKFLVKCLESILNQSYKNIEVICVDDGSTDDSLKILKEYSLKDNRIKVFTQKNSGAAIARNYGLGLANGKYVIFLDGDDYIDNDLILQTLKKAEQYKADIVIFKGVAFDSGTGSKGVLNDRINKMQVYESKTFNYTDIHDKIFNSFLIQAWNKLYSRAFIINNEIKFQELKRSNDIFFTCATLVQASKIILLNKTLIFYRKGRINNLQSGNDETPLDFFKALYKLMKYLKKNNLYDKTKYSFDKLAFDVCCYNIHQVNNKNKVFLLDFLKKEGLNKLEINEKNKEYSILNLFRLIMYKYIISFNDSSNLNAFNIIYSLFKGWEYFSLHGLKETLNRVKLVQVARRRK